MFKIEMIGNLGGDAKLQANDRGQFVTFSLYHSERFTDHASGELIERTVRASCTKTGCLGALLPYLKKGFKVYVRGDGELRTFLGQDGSYHSGINLRVAELEPLWDKKKEDNNEDPF